MSYNIKVGLKKRSWKSINSICDENIPLFLGTFVFSEKKIDSDSFPIYIVDNIKKGSIDLTPLTTKEININFK